jgi:hypothetical protein
VRIMSVEERGLVQLAQYGGDDSRVEPEPPPGPPDCYTRVAEPACELAIRPRYDNLRNAQPPKLTCEKPDLTLPSAPFPSRRDMDDPRNHVPGRTSAGRAGVLRAESWCPLSRSTSARSVRSSARLNGLWR